MKAFVAFYICFTLPIWQCLADDCSEDAGSCRPKHTSLMQFKSSSLKKQALSLDTEGSFRSKLAGVQKFTDEMVAQFGAGESAEPSQPVLDAVATVLEFIDDMYVSLKTAHGEDVSLAGTCDSNLADCGVNYMNESIKAEISSYKSASDTLELNHTRCRTEAQTECSPLCETNGPCSQYDSYRKNPSQSSPALLPSCVTDGFLGNDYIRADEKTETGMLEDMEDCLVQMKVWLDGQYPSPPGPEGLYTLYSECDRVKTDCPEKVESCDNLQKQFQASRCLYAMESNIRCDDFESCFSSARHACKTDCQQIAIRAAARAADNETGQRLVCLLHTLFGEPDPANSTGTGFKPRPSDEQRPTLLAGCNEAVEVEGWSISCPSDPNGLPPAIPPFPSDIPCPGSHVTSPCGDDFKNEMGWPAAVPFDSSSTCSATAHRGKNGIPLPCVDAGGSCEPEPRLVEVPRWNDESVLSGGQGETLHMVCDSDKFSAIRVKAAWAFCQGSKRSQSGYTGRVRHVCDGQSDCKIGYNGGGLNCADCTDVRIDDPCPGKPKTLHAEFICSNAQFVSGGQGETIDLKCSDEKSVLVSHSNLACEGRRHSQSSYSSTIRHVCNGKSDCKVGYNGGGLNCADCTDVRLDDPCPGKPKTLTVSYKCIQGTTLSGLQGDTLEMTCSDDRSIVVKRADIDCDGQRWSQKYYTPRVRHVCDGQSDCKIGYNGGGLNCADCTDVRIDDPCPGKPKILNAMYDCAHGNHLSGGQGEILEMTCSGPGSFIQVVRADVACDGTRWNGGGYTNRIREVCEGKLDCKIGYNGGGLNCVDCTDVRIDDPCPGKPKTLHATYKCQDAYWKLDSTLSE